MSGRLTDKLILSRANIEIAVCSSALGYAFSSTKRINGQFRKARPGAVNGRRNGSP